MAKATVLKKENIVISSGEYQKEGKTKQEYRTIGELVTMQDEDGSTYQFGKMWGPTGSTPFNVYLQEDKQQSAPTQQPAAPLQQTVVGYQDANGNLYGEKDVQRFKKANIAPWPVGQQPPLLPAGF